MTIADAPSRLHRVLGPIEVTASGVGIIIGAGIYVLLGAAAQEAGPAVWLSFAIAAALCALSGMSYCELSSMFPDAGAEYDYTRRVFPQTVSFLVGWTMVAGLIVASAAVAIGFAHYLTYFLDVPIALGAIGLLLFNGAFALGGIRRSARLTVALSAVQVLALLAIVGIGLPHVGNVNLLQGASADGVVGGAALVFFAFIGFDEVTTLAEETANPTRVIPRALLVALAISAFLYMAIAVAAVSVIDAQALGNSTRPLADVAAHVLGGRAQGVVAVVALATTVNTSLLAMTAASRMLYGMAESEAMPRAVLRVSARSGAPLTAIVVVTVAACGFAAAGDLRLVASVTDFAVYAVFLAVNATVIILRRRAPSLPRPFRIPGSIAGIPVVPVLGFAATVAMMPQLDFAATAIGAIVVAIGLAFNYVQGRLRSTRRHAATLDAW